MLTEYKNEWKKILEKKISKKVNSTKVKKHSRYDIDVINSLKTNHMTQISDLSISLDITMMSLDL